MADGTGFVTSHMVEDPVIGSEHVFWLERLDGDWFLAAGANSVLAVGPAGVVTDRSGHTFPLSGLAGVCR
jgi:hypothetical protein